MDLEDQREISRILTAMCFSILVPAFKDAKREGVEVISEHIRLVWPKSQQESRNKLRTWVNGSGLGSDDSTSTSTGKTRLNNVAQRAKNIGRTALGRRHVPVKMCWVNCTDCVSLLSAMATLQFSPDYWENNLPGIEKLSPEAKLHLILSLVIYLGISIRALMFFIFESNIQPVKDRASRFLDYDHHTPTPKCSFLPHISSLYGPKGVLPLYSVIRCESDRIIIDPSLRIRLKDLTIGILQLLQPGILADKYQGLAPFLYGLLRTFSASPNDYRTKKERKEEKERDAQGSDSDSSAVPESDPDWDDDPEIEHDEAGAAESTPQ
ncbi:hypothetical protein B0H17DRAFT_1138977 [Mycena rosella]|uniref:Uncharacterized protein n=1 Tax=Mycena rosella TaxID=1033263 RepID=A0AAD7GD21_MYCRO|nr:hypothetical protein B0H17DRAFT_1138977 [Mycena rosella]